MSKSSRIKVKAAKKTRSSRNGKLSMFDNWLAACKMHQQFNINDSINNSTEWAVCSDKDEKERVLVLFLKAFRKKDDMTKLPFLQLVRLLYIY